MRKIWVVLSLGIALPIGYSFCRPATAQTPRTAWQYKVEMLGPFDRTDSRPEKVENVLNEMVGRGWEFVQAVPYSDSKGPNQLLLLFKRSK